MTADEDSLTETAREWLAEEYDDFPKGIDDFGRRQFSPVPTVILNDPLDVELLIKTIEDFGFETKTKRAESGQILVAACVPSPAQNEEHKVVYTFDDTPETNLDSPRRHEEVPENGRTMIVIEYLNRRY